MITQKGKKHGFNAKLFVEEADELLNGYTEESLRKMQKKQFRTD